jgi:hypothetical protein
MNLVEIYFNLIRSGVSVVPPQRFSLGGSGEGDDYAMPSEVK